MNDELEKMCKMKEQQSILWYYLSIYLELMENLTEVNRPPGCEIWIQDFPNANHLTAVFGEKVLMLIPK